MPTEWWPHTAIGIASLVSVILGIVGAGAWGVIRKWIYGPLERKIADERAARKRAIEDEARERKHDFARIDDPETGRITLHRSALKHDIDEVGAIVNHIRQDMAGRETRTRALEDRMRDSEQDRAAIHRELGRNTERVAAVEEKVQEIAVNIIGAVQSAKEETLRAVDTVREKVNELGKQVAVIQDRQERDGEKRRDG